MTPEMSNENFSRLLSDLKIGFIVFIEDEFRICNDCEVMLGSLFNVNPSDVPLIISELEKIGAKNIAEKIHHVISTYPSLPHDAKSQELLVKKNGKILEYLKKILDKDDKLIDHCEKLITELCAIDNEQLKLIFFKYGIGENFNNYSKIFAELKKLTTPIPMRFYQSMVPAELDSFISDINEAVKQYGSDNYLCIVDKMLGDHQNQGVEFINNSLDIVVDKTGISPLSFIFSSSPVAHKAEKPSDYYRRELNKQSVLIIEEIITALAQCAYAKIFEKLEKTFHESSSSAAKLVIQNHKNINHILNKAQSEGLTPFDALFNWFHLALLYYADEILKSDLLSTFGLAKFFDNQYLPTYGIDDVKDEELLKLNTFEIFDYSVNKKHLSIGVGDVFFVNDKYYIVVGQECDLLIREQDNKRNSKVIELLEAKFDSSPSSSNKLGFSYDDNRKTITIQNFINSKGVRGSLIIQSVTKHLLSNTELMDLCMFNSEGKCMLNLEEQLNDNIKSVLPKGKDVYYDQIRSFLNNIYSMLTENPDLALHINSLDFNNSDYQVSGVNEIDYGLIRLCRVKGNFKYFINKAFYDFRSRIDLNLISNTEDTFTLSTIRIILDGIEEYEIKSSRVYQSNKEKYILKGELPDSIPEKLTNSIKSLPDRITLHSKDEKYHAEEANGSVLISLSFVRDYGGSKKFIKSKSISLKDLIETRGQQLDSSTFKYIDTDEEESIFDEDGVTHKQISISSFVRGIEIQHTNLKRITLDNELLTIRDILEARVKKVD